MRRDIDLKELERLATERQMKAMRDIYIYYAKGPRRDYAEGPESQSLRHAVKVQCPTRPGLLTTIASYQDPLIAIVVDVEPGTNKADQIARYVSEVRGEGGTS